MKKIKKKVLVFTNTFQKIIQGKTVRGYFYIPVTNSVVSNFEGSSVCIYHVIVNKVTQW